MTNAEYKGAPAYIDIMPTMENHPATAANANADSNVNNEKNIFISDRGNYSDRIRLFQSHRHQNMSLYKPVYYIYKNQSKIVDYL